MRYYRKAVLQSLDKSNYSNLENFIHELRTHSMYRSIVEMLIALPGFHKKEYTIRDDASGQIAISTIEFNTKEGWENYRNDETFQSVWTYLELMAEQSGIGIEITEHEED